MTAKNYHHGDLKNALIKAGIAMLEEDGLAAVSLRAIAAKVGVSHTAPKNHFGSLKGLLTAIATEAFRRHSAYMTEGITEGASREDRLNAAMNGYVRFAADHSALFQLMFSPLHCDFDDPELLEASKESYGVLRGIADGLEWAQSDAPNGALRTELMLWSLVHGYAMLQAIGQFGPNNSASVPTIADLMPGVSYPTER